MFNPHRRHRGKALTGALSVAEHLVVVGSGSRELLALLCRDPCHPLSNRYPFCFLTGTVYTASA